MPNQVCHYKIVIEGSRKVKIQCEFWVQSERLYVTNDFNILLAPRLDFVYRGSENVDSALGMWALQNSSPFLIPWAVSHNLIRAQLFRKKQCILYPSFEYYPGGATDPFWKGHEYLFFLRFRFRRQHFLQLLYEMELSGKIFRCYTGKPDDKNRKYHNYPADLCIMVVLIISMHIPYICASLIMSLRVAYHITAQLGHRLRVRLRALLDLAE